MCAVPIVFMCMTLWLLFTSPKFGNNNNKHCNSKSCVLIIILCVFKTIDKYWRQKYVFINEFRNICQQKNIFHFWKWCVNQAIKTKILLATLDNKFQKWGQDLLIIKPEVLYWGKYSKLLITACFSLTYATFRSP